jgi:hypothetical protein
MILLFASAAPAIHVADYPVLLASSAFLGAGFGMAIPALVTYAMILSGRSEIPVLAINALLLLGVAVPPIYALAFPKVPYWWGPAVLTLLLALLLIAGRRLPATRAADAAMQPVKRRVPAQVKVYELLVILYGLCAVMCVAWSEPNALRPGHPHLTFIALVLGAFWAALVMLARFLFAMLDRMPAAALTTSALFVLTGGVVVGALVVSDFTLARFGIWALAALACAALLPLRTQGKDALTTLSVALAGAMALLYPLAIGLARASLTALHQDGLSLRMIFGIVAVIGVAASVLLLKVLSPRQDLR